MGSLVRGWHVASLALLLALCFATTYADECREEDFIGQYTACQGGFKNLIYYKNPDSDCTGTTNQPSNIFRIPCALSCPSGQYLPLGSQSEAACTPCGSGSYSLGGGVRIEGSSWVNSPSGWNAMSNNQISFRSTCVNTRDGTIPSLSQCTRWTIVDGVLTSSNRTGDNMMSVLEASATFVRPGTISFDYRVDSERDFDYFSFDIDETNKIRMESQRLDYVKVSFNVDIGTHVFKWKYTKDFSLAYGDDAVIVRMIEVTGTAFADSTCTQCPAGTFAAGVGNVGCTDCAANSAAPNPGMAQCNDCGPTKFSYSGAATCRDRVDCVASDVFSYFSDCFANRTRNKYYAFLEPKICSDLGASAYKKPADVYSVACAPCSPGWYRNSEGVCQGCPTNYMSSGGGQDVSSCQACPTGHVGRRDFIWTNFEELPSAEIPASMGCRGECGTPGWRLGPNFIDSGVGHNAYADSYFMLNLTTTIDSSVSFNYSFECDRLCYISYTDHDITGSNASDPHLMQTRTSYSFFFTKSTHLTMEIPVSSGDHMFTWHFSKFDRTVDSKEDRIKIYGIQIKSVKENQGGAASCQPCSAGYYADSAFPYCKLTPPGTFSGNLASVPTDCPVNTYAELPGSTGCLACGAGTTAPARSAWCDESCTFQLRPDLSYDLKPLSRVQGDMYGPIVDPATRRNFFINVCTREHTNSSCVNDDGFPVSTQACLADIYGYGMDVGRVTNFYAHPTTPEMGLKLTYTRSNFDTLSTCRIGGVTTPRTTSILFNCDPTAGYGTPTFSAVGSNSCTFNFVWNTLFACPACDDSDWSYYYTECSNGKQMKTYQWKDNPRKCHGGLPLPESVERPCTVETQVCPKGQYLLEECTDCESGKFSLGGARVVNYWQMGSPIQAPFSALPSEVSAAVPRGSFVQLAFPPTFQGNWVSLQAEFNFIQASTVTFSASALVGEGYTLSLRQDAQDFTPFATALTAQLYTIPVTSGTHSFTFNLTRSKLPGTLMPGFLRLYNFTANDIARAASQCTSATPGTIVTSPTQQSTPCPINTYQPSGSQTSCKSATAENRWAPEGSTMSYLPPACNYQDFMPTAATTCSNGRMNYNMDYKQPRICQNGWPQSAISTSCSCLPGYRMDNNGNCITCSANEAYDESTRTCRRPAKGSAAVKIWSMIKGRTSLSAPSSAARNVDATEAGLDATWTTSCSGKCFRAWSVSATPDLGLVMDSGIQMSNAISTLDIDVPMSNQAGLLSISYTKTAGPTTTFMILVDGVVVHTDKQTTRQFPLKAVAGSHKISLVLMVDPNTDGADVLASATIRVDSLTVTGAAVGGAVIQRCPAGTFASEDGAMACIACEPGTYASAEGSSTCTMCAAGTFAAFYGSATCTACPAGTTAESTGAKLCDANCLLTVGSLTYDWRDLHPTYATLTPEQRALGFPDIQIDPCVGLPEYCSGSSAYVCGTSPLSATANNVNYGSRLYRQSFTSNAILIQYDSGERCLSSSSLSRTANLQLRCPPRPNFATSAPVITSLSDCHVELTWFTNSACPACTAADYKAVPGECSGRQQTVNYVLSSEGCHHSEYTQPPSTVRKCSSVGVSIGVVVGVGIAIIFLALSLAIFFLRHRKLSTEYRLLKDAHDSNFDLPETQFGVDDEEDGVTLDHIDDDDDGLRLPTAQTAEDDE